MKAKYVREAASAAATCTTLPREKTGEEKEENADDEGRRPTEEKLL